MSLMGALTSRVLADKDSHRGIKFVDFDVRFCRGRVGVAVLFTA